MKRTAIIGVAVIIALAICAVVVVAMNPRLGSRGGEGRGVSDSATAPQGDAGQNGAAEGDLTQDDAAQVAPAGELPEIPAGKGIISAVTMDSATTEPGGPVLAEGTLVMPEGQEGDVAISVSWVNPETSSVYARGVTTLKGVKPGEERKWEVKAELPADAEGSSTVLGAVIVE